MGYYDICFADVNEEQISTATEEYRTTDNKVVLVFDNLPFTEGPFTVSGGTPFVTGTIQVNT